MGPEPSKKDAVRVLVAGLSANMLEQLTDMSVGSDGMIAIDTEGPSQGILRSGRRQPFSVEQGDAPRPGVLSVKTYHRPNPKDPAGLNTLPIKRATPKRPAGMSARQWKKAQKAARREDPIGQALEFNNW